MLARMRALPGRASRIRLPNPAPDLTRETVAEEQRRRIRRATGELVAKRGYAGVSVELIVKRARVSFKTFYKHYANKEEAFADLFDHATGRDREPGPRGPRRTASRPGPSRSPSPFAPSSRRSSPSR